MTGGGGGGGETHDTRHDTTPRRPFPLRPTTAPAAPPAAGAARARCPRSWAELARQGGGDAAAPPLVLASRLARGPPRPSPAAAAVTSRQQWRQRDRRLPTRRVTGASAGGGGGVRARARAHRLVCGAGGRDGAPFPPPVSLLGRQRRARHPPRAAAVAAGRALASCGREG